MTLRRHTAEVVSDDGDPRRYQVQIHELRLREPSLQALRAHGHGLKELAPHHGVHVARRMSL